MSYTKQLFEDEWHRVKNDRWIDDVPTIRFVRTGRNKVSYHNPRTGETWDSLIDLEELKRKVERKNDLTGSSFELKEVFFGAERQA